MEMISEHWLSFGAGIFLLGMVLYGHHRGFLRIAVTLTAFVISIVVIRLATPYMTTFLKEHTEIQQLAKESLIKAVGLDFEEEGGQDLLPAHQRITIEQMKLPQQMKKILLDNNNSEVYQRLGVNTFLEYIGSFLADMVLNLSGSVLLFVIVYFGLRLLARWFDLIARLPILCGMNQITGAVLGGIRGLIWLWLFFLAADLCASMGWAEAVRVQIQHSTWLTVLYNNNLINWFLAGILSCLI